MSEIDLSSPLNYGTPSSMGSIRTPKSGIRGTPIRMRPDVRSDKRIRQVNVASDPVSNLLLQKLIAIIVQSKNKYFYLSISIIGGILCMDKSKI